MTATNRQTGNCIVGPLNGEKSDCWLLDCVEMDKCNAQTVVQLVNKSLEILWPNGIQYQKVDK